MAGNYDFPIIQVVGYKNSGKTTVTAELINYASSQGIRVASLKHHGHSTALTPVHTITDSSRHKQAGAFLSGVEGGGAIQLEFNEIESLPLERLLDIYEIFTPDLVIMEGFKKYDYPKIVLIKNEKEMELASSLSNVRAVIAWENVTADVPIFHINKWRQQLSELMRLLLEEGGS
ncbi:molybdopterin-guanine dinucleotide biosynthesis protein B [Thalassobacillus pellis]|uniref:molybdopterin-guanine dinucleotide biosynthesis protein B n=1 Tax=Thalassobacillus pellis TaxID=748008 RepID=UPI001960E3FD|nr:molybdopterin-guanine dinucleotide biosynthesis protein B [Thalassobacillus pellis]MBM7554059.1 molybdopterin-guanine dinucleotide biosynthesis protein B [Thalassobacillus pellis]